MMTFIATLMTASAAFITPTPEGDVDAFIRFMWATERCPGVVINYDKTLEQVGDLGDMMKWPKELTREKLMVQSRIAEVEYNQDHIAFCDGARKLYYSYDPAYLRTVGVTD